MDCEHCVQTKGILCKRKVSENWPFKMSCLGLVETETWFQNHEPIVFRSSSGLVAQQCVWVGGRLLCLLVVDSELLSSAADKPLGRFEQVLPMYVCVCVCTRVHSTDGLVGNLSHYCVCVWH